MLASNKPVKKTLMQSPVRFEQNDCHSNMFFIKFQKRGSTPT